MTATAFKPSGSAPPWAVAALIVVSFLPLITHLPWWALAGAIIFIAWRYGEGRYLGRPSRALRWLLVFLVTLLIYLQFHTLFGERPGLSFLVMLMGLKCLEARSSRDAVVLVLLSYVALLGDLLFEPSIAIGAFTLVFLVASFVALSVITQPVGLTMRRRWRQSSLLLLQAIPLALIAYVVFPRIAGGLWRSTPQPIGQTGLTPVLRPGSMAALLSSRAVAMRVIFHGRRPPRDQRYFRAYVLTETNGRVWRQAPGGLGLGGGTTKGQIYASYTVLLNPTNNHILPALDWPVAAPHAGALKGGALLRSQHAVRHLLRYKEQAAGVRQDYLTPEERRQDLALPRNVSARIRALAAHFAQHAGPRNVRARVIAQRALRYFVRHHFVYTLNPPPMGHHPITRFLFHVRAGYCEDYAAAFATLMRAAGVPTRIVVGFLGGEFNPDGGDVIVRNWDAHSWTEIWMNGTWRRVDPTAVVAPGALHERLGTLRRLLAHESLSLGAYQSFWVALHHHLQLLRDAATTNWDNWVVDYSGRRQAALLKRLGWQDAGPFSLGIATLVLGVLAMSLVKTLGGRHRKPRDPAYEVYQRYCQRMARIGLARETGEGPRAYGLRTSQIRPDLKQEIMAITERYIAIRYGGKPEGLRGFKDHARRFRPRPARH